MNRIQESVTTHKTKNDKAVNLFMIALLLAALFLGSCSKKIAFQNSSVVPAARGTVKVTQDKNKNYVIKLDIKNLAEPGRLAPPKNTYIVWLESDHNVIKNIGQINSSTGFMSDKLSASFQTVSAMKPIKIFLTSEDDASTQYPSYPVVFTTNKF